MDDEVERLYGLPLGEFTSARNELAKRLGDAEIRKLKKPSVAAWAVNQLARRREVDVQRLLRAGEQLQETQREAVLGGDQRAFEQARREERDAVRRLRSGAAELLRSGGHPESDATLERVARTLHAAAATDDGRAALRGGRLTEELEPQGFDALTALAGPTPKRRRPARVAAPRPSPADRRRARKAREEAAAARRAADGAAKRLREAEQELERARREAERADEKAGRLEAKAKELESAQ